jgi:hypothetical protein
MINSNMILGLTIAGYNAVSRFFDCLRHGRNEKHSSWQSKIINWQDPVESMLGSNAP